MAGLNVEGDTVHLNVRQLEFIKSVIEQRGYKTAKVNITQVGKAGDNYIANVKRIVIEDDNGETFKIIAKIAPNHEIARQMTNTEFLFHNEYILYTKVFPKFTNLEISAEIPPQERLRYAACYGVLNEPPNEVILLEDLNESDFIMLDRFKPLEPECVKSVLRNFALLHSLSYALKYKEPEVYEEYKNSLWDMWAQMESNQDAMLYMKQMESNANKTLDSDNHKKAVLGAVTGSLNELARIASNDKDTKHSVIIQGDAWTNNMLFKFDGETVSESIMIDYQISKAANPTADLLYFIFNSTDYKSRKLHFHDWIDYYHNELGKALTSYGLKASFVYPRDQLDADLKKYSKIYFGLAIILAGTLSMNTEEASTMKAAMEASDINGMTKSSEMTEKDPATVAIFKKKIEGLIDSCRELGFM